MDLDAIGGAATGGLIAGAIEKPTGHAGEAQGVCSDCGAEVSGRFCSNCGQPTHVHRTLLHLGEELLHGVMHFDSRAWRTLPLLVFRPGRLTREWVHGKRTRYVSPLAMFLFTVFVMFMLLTYMPMKPAETIGEAQARLGAQAVAQAAAVASAEQALAAAPIAARPGAEARLVAARRQLAETREDLSGMQMVSAKVGGSARWQDSLRSEVQSGRFNLDLGDKKLEEKLLHKLENPDLAIYKLQQTFYKFSFLLVPLSVPFVALLFLWRRGLTLYDHGVFVLYSLTFMSLLLLVTAFIMRLGGAWESLTLGALPFIVPAHMFFQLKGAYSLSVGSALWRTALLLVFCAVVLVLFFLAIVWLGVL